MTTQEVIEIVKQSHLWESLPPKEKRETIIYTLKICNVPIDEQEIQSIVGEVFSDSEELQDLRELGSKEEN